MNKKYFIYTLPMILLLIVAVSGWFATDYLGNKARQEIISEGQASVLTLSTYVSSTLTTIEGAVKSLSGSPWIAPGLLSKSDKDIQHANSALDRYNAALNASVSYLMDDNGMTVASTNRKDPDSFVGKSYRFRPYFLEAVKGQPYRYFAMGITSGKRGFYASYPVQNRLGKVLGVVTMKKDLDDMGIFFRKFPFCFLISPEGIIFLSSKPEMVLKSFWPLDKTTQQTLIASQQFGNKLSEAMTPKEIADGTEVTLEGKDHFVSRKVIDSGGWSIVVLNPTDRIWIYKLTGILTTIFVCFIIVIFWGSIYFTDRSREAIRQSEEKFRTIFDNSSAMAIIEKDTTISMVNKEYCRIGLYEESDVIGMSWTKQIPSEDLKRLEEYNRKRLINPESAPSNYEFSFYRKDGKIRNGLISVAVLPNTQKIVASFIDITERKRAEEALRESEHRYQELSIIDDLTQLYNSRHFYAQLEREMERSNRYGQPLTLLMLDLDKFKNYNDTYGHLEGNQVLSRLGQVIKRCLRDTDSAYRYGGEEFMIMLPMTASREGIVTAERIQSELMKEVFSPVLDQKVYMTVSIGLAQYKPKEELTSFVQRIDQFMYEAKRKGRNRICSES